MTMGKNKGGGGGGGGGGGSGAGEVSVHLIDCNGNPLTLSIYQTIRRRVAPTKEAVRIRLAVEEELEEVEPATRVALRRHQNPRTLVAVKRAARNDANTFSLHFFHLPLIGIFFFFFFE